MDYRSHTSKLMAFLKATLVGVALFTMATSVPHAWPLLWNFFRVALPSAASAFVTPKKCLFVFSNIIVIFLANECKLSRRRAARSMSGDGSTDAAASAPAVTEQINHSTEDNVKEQEEDSVVALYESMQQLENQFKLNDASSAIFRTDELREEEGEVSVKNDVERNVMEVEEQGRFESIGEVVEDKESEGEDIGLPTDELNRRVEDFIARFNMERQLEERCMLACAAAEAMSTCFMSPCTKVASLPDYVQ